MAYRFYHLITFDRTKNDEILGSNSTFILNAATLSILNFISSSLTRIFYFRVSSTKKARITAAVEDLF